MVYVDFSGTSVSFSIKNNGRLSFREADKLKSEIEKFLDNPVHVFMLDLKGIHFIDSYSCSVLLMLHELFDRKEKALCLVNVSDSLSELLELVGLDKVLKTYAVDNLWSGTQSGNNMKAV